MKLEDHNISECKKLGRIECRTWNENDTLILDKTIKSTKFNTIAINTSFDKKHDA
jgi:hypothetical protein